MLLLPHHHLGRPTLPPPSARSTKKLIRPIVSMSSSSTQSSIDFPYFPAPQRSLMTTLLNTVEAHLDSSLLPSSLSPDVQLFQSPTGTSKGALHIRSGKENSVVDLLLSSWLHCGLPTGATMDIATLFASVGPATDAPHLLVELNQRSPTSLILFVDLFPRRDIVLYPEYLKMFYEDTGLDAQRQKLLAMPETSHYFSSNLYIRGMLSPTAISVTVSSDEGGSSLKESVTDVVDRVVKEVVRIWLDAAGNKGGSGSDLAVRDALLKKKGVEIDLAANLPMLFGEEVGGRVVAAIENAYRGTGA